MTKRKYRTDEEWLSLIQECRLSGLTDKQWCETHQICPSNFYYQIQKFRKRACEIPESHSKTTLTAQKQEVVQVTFEQSAVSEQNILSPVYQRTQRQMQQFLCRLMAFRSESQMQRPKVQSFILCQRCIACGIQCLSPAKKYKVYKSSINKSLHFAQRSLSRSTRGQRVTAQLNLSRE